MNDAFGNEVNVGDPVLYATKTVAGSTYTIGTVVELVHAPNPRMNKVRVQVSRKTYGPIAVEPTTVIVENVVKYKELP